MGRYDELKQRIEEKYNRRYTELCEKRLDLKDEEKEKAAKAQAIKDEFKSMCADNEVPQELKDQFHAIDGNKEVLAKLYRCVLWTIMLQKSTPGKKSESDIFRSALKYLEKQIGPFQKQKTEGNSEPESKKGTVPPYFKRPGLLRNEGNSNDENRTKSSYFKIPGQLSKEEEHTSGNTTTKDSDVGR